MENETTARAIQCAERYRLLGLHVHSWDVLETLPPAERLQPAVLAVSLLVCTRLQKWEIGVELARWIGGGYPLSAREAAGRFHLARAEALCAAGDLSGGHEAVWALSTVWPEGRAVALGSTALAAIWQDRPDVVSMGETPHSAGI